MKFLCDVHISIKLVKLLNSLGHEAIHINNILNHSETTDREICEFADRNNYAVVTKDSDFRDSHLLSARPRKLIKINLGNISNQQLMRIFETNIYKISQLDQKKQFLLEIEQDDLRLLIS